MLASHVAHHRRSSRFIVLFVLAALVLLGAAVSYEVRIWVPPTHRQQALRGQPIVIQEQDMGNHTPECRPLSGFTC